VAVGSCAAREEEQQVAKLKAERTAAAREAGEPIVPQAPVVARYLENLFTLLETDPERAGRSSRGSSPPS
jgi:hypothetical protein